MSFVKINNNLIINWVSDIWLDESAINQIMVNNSFRTTDISNNLNGNENFLFKIYDKLREEIVIEWDRDEKEQIAENDRNMNLKNKLCKSLLILYSLNEDLV